MREAKTLFFSGYSPLGRRPRLAICALLKHLGICHTKIATSRTPRYKKRYNIRSVWQSIGETPPTLPFRLPPAEKDGDERLTYDVPEAGQSLDARRRPGVCDARPLAMARAHANECAPNCSSKLFHNGGAG